MKQNTMWNALEGITFIWCVLCSIFIIGKCNEEGFGFLWVLPLTCAICQHALYSYIKRSNKTVFFLFFTAIVFIRYTAGPFLIVLTGEYFGRIVRSIPSPQSINIAIFLMSYELVVCIIYIWIKIRRTTPGEFQNSWEVETVLPERTTVYSLLFLVTLVLTAINPITITYFSFATIGMAGLNISDITLLSQITIMLQMSCKCFIFIVVISKLKRLYDNANNKLPIEIIAASFTLFWSMIYYGHNRADFLFSVICQFYVFFLLFPKNRKKYLGFVVIVILIVLPYMTQNRNYTDYYTETTGLDRLLRSYSGIIGAYFGGITNVGVGVDFTSTYSQYRTIGQFTKDLLVPIVGINKILPLGDEMLTNTLFNYQFFATIRQPSQILPSIGQGYFYFGFIFAPLLDVIQLSIVFWLEKYKKRINRIELILLFNIVEMRFALMFGQNITQQINGLSMELMVPIIFYWMNCHIVMGTRGKINAR